MLLMYLTLLWLWKQDKEWMRSVHYEFVIIADHLLRMMRGMEKMKSNTWSVLTDAGSLIQ
jgi:hypothetical protein